MDRIVLALVLYRDGTMKLLDRDEFLRESGLQMERVILVPFDVSAQRRAA